MLDNQTPEQLTDIKYEKSRKLKKRLGAVITASVILAVIIINIIFGIFAYKRLWYVDLTLPKYAEMQSLYTASEQFEGLIASDVITSIDRINADREQKGLEKLKVDIIFCSDPDILDENEHTRLVHYTARTLRKEFPEHFNIEYTDVKKNPSSVQKYKITSASTINPTDVIFSFGTEFGVHTLNSFFTVDEDVGEVWAYNGEKKFTATILSLTRTDSPVCALTTNHGEGLFDRDGDKITVKEKYSSFIKIIEGAGYRVELLDLERDAIPENCRMMICFAPTKDFYAFGNSGSTGISEIDKLDKYIDDANAFFYICDRQTPTLTNLEEYLDEWGISPMRATNEAGIDENYEIYDNISCTDKDGNILIGKYASAGLGASITTDLRALPYPPVVAFGSSCALTPSESYRKVFVNSKSDGSGEDGVIYSYYKNGISRTMYDVFLSGENSFATASNSTKYASDIEQFRLFTLTEEAKQVQDTYYSITNLRSFVIGASSTEFFSNEYLDSAAFGNSDVLLSTFRYTSEKNIPVSLDFKAFYEYEINDVMYQTVKPSRIMAYLCFIPPLVFLCVCVIIRIRRKHL
ncbi:MAG: hypothetical protein E7667_04315 [Ruminococcaceae bacterium]|nr:hypothetical protein [Oscillospiraceae bacterium]